jgi:hypothetical protein
MRKDRYDRHYPDLPTEDTLQNIILIILASIIIIGMLTFILL